MYTYSTSNCRKDPNGNWVLNAQPQSPSFPTLKPSDILGGGLSPTTAIRVVCVKEDNLVVAEDIGLDPYDGMGDLYRIGENNQVDVKIDDVSAFHGLGFIALKSPILTDYFMVEQANGVWFTKGVQRESWDYLVCEVSPLFGDQLTPSTGPAKIILVKKS